MLYYDSMRKFSATVTLVLFFVWIMPLGLFISRENEEEACFGKRAICLCSQLVEKQLRKRGFTTFLKAGASTENTQAGSATGSPNYILSIRQLLLVHNQLAFTQRNLTLHQSLFVRPIDHVPKV